jgi:hypothetical protein
VSPSLTYVYCLVRSARRPTLPPASAGLPGSRDLRLIDATGKPGPAGRPRQTPVDRLWIVAATVDASEFDETALAKGLQKLEWVGPRAMAHETVVEHYLSAAAVLPMQLFTMFTSDERAMAHVTRDRARLDRILARLDRHHEWGLRLTFDDAAAKAAVEDAAQRNGRVQASGAAYLRRKRDVLEATRGGLARARSGATRLYTAMSREATEARRRRATEAAAPDSRLLLDAAFLVPVRRTAAFRRALAGQAHSLTAAGIVVSLTGPWPPYNFIDASSRRKRP